MSFHNLHTEPLPSDHSLDLVTFCDVLHDTAFPQEILTATRVALKSDGAALVIDIDQPEAVSDKLSHPFAPMAYAISMALCMSSALSEEGGAGLGTFGLHESLLQEMASTAGFTRFRRLETNDPFNAYYELRP